MSSDQLTGNTHMVHAGNGFMRAELVPEDLESGEFLLLPEILQLDEGPVREHAVVVRRGLFGEIGPAADIVRKNPRLTPIRLDRSLLMPGFVDTHTHLTQSFGKSLVFGEPSEIFRRVWVPLEQSLNEDTAYLASKLAALEALRGGFTTVCDAGTRAHIDIAAVARATREVGIRCVLGLICNDVTTGESTHECSTVMRKAEEHLRRYNDRDLIHPSLAVSIPEAASDQVLQSVSRLSAEAQTVLQIHLNEHLVSVERSLEQRGLRPLEHLAQIGALGPQVLAAHATLLTPAEVKLLADTDTAVSYCPVASAWKGNAVAPAAMMAELGIRFGLGTDATRGDGFRLMDAAEMAQRLSFGIQVGDSSCGSGWTWLEHATGAGAEAAGLGQITGKIEVGKAADFLLIDLRVPEMHPSWDPTWELVRLANRDQIVAVVVEGRLRLWRGWPRDWDAQALLQEVDKVATKVIGAAPIRRIHPGSMEHRRRHGVRPPVWSTAD